MSLNKTEILEEEPFEEYVPPKNLKSYDVMQLISSGGQGDLYRARDKNTGQIIALKSIRLSSKNPIILENAEEEVKILEELSKPCYPFISCYYSHSYDVDDNKFLIEMEFIEGRNLEVFGNEVRTSKFFYQNLRDIMYDLSVALNYIHSKNVIHRDIKPDNILISYENIPKLIDFGLACVSKPECYETECCKGDPGTPVFMPPETFEYRQSYFASDVWGLGASIFKVAANEYCFDFPDYSKMSNDLQKIAAVKQTIIYEEPNILATTDNILNTAVNSSLIKNLMKRINVDDLIKLLKRKI